MDVFVPIPAENGEWVVVDSWRELEKMLGSGANAIPFWRRPIRAQHVDKDEQGNPRRAVEVPWMGSHGLVVKPAARAVMEPLFGDAVQYIRISGTPYRQLHYVHVRRHADVLDEGRSDIIRFSPGPGIMDIRRHAFTSAVEWAGPIFKLRQDPRGSVYLTGMTVAALLGSNLTGLCFEKIWSSEA
jgi:hypothetical protein